MSSGFLVPTKEGALIRLRVSPGAKRTGIRGTFGEDALKIRVAAPPVSGRANAETERFVAEVLGVSRSEVELVRGAAGRDIALLVRGAAVEDLERALSGYLS